MKNSNGISALVVALTVFASGCASDENMRRSLELYEPPAYYRNLAGSEPQPPAAELYPATETASAISRLEEQKARWKAAVESIDAEEGFYTIAPSEKKTLEKIAEDDESAARALAEKISLEELKALTLSRNPGIKAAEERLRAELESFTQVANLDEILRQYTAFTEGLMVGVGPMKGKEPVSMQFPFPGVTALKGQVVRMAVEAQRENLEIARRDAVTQAVEVFWELSYTEKAQEIAFETLELLKRLEAVADTRYRSGNTSFQDVIKIKIRIGLLEENLTTLRRTERNLDAKIVELASLPTDARLGRTKRIEPPENVPPPDALYAIAKERRQEIRRLRANIGKMERMIEMSETMILPPYTLGFSFYEDEAIGMVGSDAKKPAFPTATEAGRGAGLPKSPWYGVEDPWLEQTRMQLSAMRQQLRNTLSETETMVRNAWFMLDKAIREYRLYRDRIVDLSGSALEVSTRGYESGTVSFADVIGSYTTWTDVNLSAARKRSDAGVAWAGLEKVVGARIEKP